MLKCSLWREEPDFEAESAAESKERSDEGESGSALYDVAGLQHLDSYTSPLLEGVRPLSAVLLLIQGIPF